MKTIPPSMNDGANASTCRLLGETVTRQLTRAYLPIRASTPTYADSMSVPIPCPSCGADHLHAAVYLDAEHGNRFEVLGFSDDPDTVIVRSNPAGSVATPEEVFLSCCACDWNDDRFVRWAE
jgi:hypothetical protein